jgi:hypothetical protein
MSFCVVQSSGESDLVSVNVPWAARNGTEVKADLPMCVFMTIEVPLCSFADPAALEIATIRQSVSLDMAATRKTSQCQVMGENCGLGGVDIALYMKIQPT